MFISSFIRLLASLLILTLIGFGIYDYVQNIDENACSMTYMRSPVYVPIKLDVDKKYPSYQLFHQCEKIECDLNEKVKFTRAGNIPVLFITGNADSHKQVRSIAALSLSKSEQAKYINENINFNFFTITFNEELSALYGPVLVRQTTYVQLCIKRILELYKTIKPESKQPRSVVIVGNSMGGIIARGIFVLNTDTFNASEYVHTIITQASPHRHAIVSSDRVMRDYYDSISSYWLSNSTVGLDNTLLVSLYGGNRDILVRNNLAQFDVTNERIMSKLTTTIPYVWRSIDHRCMAWCKEFVLVLNRILFKLVDKETRQVVEDRAKRERVFSHYLSNDNVELVESKPLNKFKKETVKLISSMNEAQLSFNDFNNKQEIVYALEVEKLKREASVDGLFIYTNLPKFQTFLSCKTFTLNDDTAYDCVDSKDLFPTYGSSIPPTELGRDIGLKVLNIDSLELQYLVIRVPVWRKSDKFYYKAILKLDWYDRSKRVQVLDVPRLSSVQHSVNFKIDEGQISFKRFVFNDFTSLAQAFKLDYLPSDCQKKLDVKKTKLLSTNLQMKFSESRDVFYFSQITNAKYTNLTLRSSRNRQELPYVDVYIFNLEHLMPDSTSEKCSNQYNFQLSISHVSILGQLVRFYSLLLPAFLVILLQFIDFSIIGSAEDTTTSSYFVLNAYLTKFSNLLLYASFLTILAFVNVNFLKIASDLEYLQSIDEIFKIGVIAILILSSYGVMSLITSLFSLIFLVLRLVFSRIFQFIYYYLNKFHQMSIINCVLLIASGLYLPVLSYIYTFYIELVSLVASKRISNQQITRLLLLHLLILIKIPALLVWIRDINNLNGILSTLAEQNFLDYDLVLMNFFVYLQNWFKFLTINNTNAIRLLVICNSCLTLLYSSLNLYRLPYFLLIHLFLSSLYRGEQVAKTKKE